MTTGEKRKLGTGTRTGDRTTPDAAPGMIKKKKKKKKKTIVAVELGKKLTPYPGCAGAMISGNGYYSCDIPSTCTEYLAVQVSFFYTGQIFGPLDRPYCPVQSRLVEEKRR